ncbi:hypothetical protein [Ruminococcus flavefaciens]|uniref:hypothetical protein n=1 Tax=Ruminococcus flavefaciens TaxID=1265 RepID=UPI0026EF4EFA|nr:hypothetical protein [Ruminococcus flavefaciens]
MKSKKKTIMFVISMVWLVISGVISVLLFTKYTEFYVFGLLIKEFAFVGIAGLIFFILLFFGCQSTYYSQSRYIVIFFGVLWIALSSILCWSSLKETFTEHINTKRYTITLSDGNVLLFYEKKGENKNMFTEVDVYRKDLLLVRGLGGFGKQFINENTDLPNYSYNEDTTEITFYGTYRYSDEMHQDFPNLKDREDTFTLKVVR